jgi:hypothetical protein
MILDSPFGLYGPQVTLINRDLPDWDRLEFSDGMSLTAAPAKRKTNGPNKPFKPRKPGRMLRLAKFSTNIECRSVAFGGRVDIRAWFFELRLSAFSNHAS